MLKILLFPLNILVALASHLIWFLFLEQDPNITTGHSVRLKKWCRNLK